MKRKKPEFSKRIMRVILIQAIIDIQLTYVLAFLGKENIAETLAITIVTEIIGSFATYAFRAHFGKKNEEIMKFERERLDMEEEQ